MKLTAFPGASTLILNKYMLFGYSLCVIYIHLDYYLLVSSTASCILSSNRFGRRGVNFARVWMRKPRRTASHLTFLVSILHEIAVNVCEAACAEQAELGKLAVR